MVVPRFDNDPPPRRITGLRIHKLFDQYDYTIPLNRVDRITILHGPNGCGKTSLFTLISALFSGDFTTIRRFLFNSFTVAFGDSTDLTVYSSFPALAEANINEPWIESYLDGKIDWREGKSLYMRLGEPDGSLDFELAPAQFQSLPRHPVTIDNFDYGLLPPLPRPSENGELTIEGRREWIFTFYSRLLGNLTSTQGVNFGRVFPQKVHFDGYDLPWPMHQFFDGTRIIPLDAERLSSLRLSDKEADKLKGLVVHALLNRLEKKTQEYRELIYDMEADFDDSFQTDLRRRMMGGEDSVPPLDVLLPAYIEYENWFERHDVWVDPELREQMYEPDPSKFYGPLCYPLSIMFSEKGTELENRTTLLLLNEHLKDMITVLDIFATKILFFRHTLLRLMSKDFAYGDILQVSESGKPEEKQEMVIAPEMLSSGEQHLIVLIATMLFEAPENSLVLIDEPELSLHVYWQRQFLEIVAEIVALNPIDVVIATHSPQVVHDRRDLTIPLGPVV